MKWTLHPASALDGMALAWNELHARSAASPLLALDFVQPLVTAFAHSGEQLARCEMNGRTVAIALVVRTGRGRWSTFQPSQAPVGLWLQERGLDVATLLASLMRALPGTPLLFGLTQCDPDLLPRPADGPRLRTMDYIDTAKITLAGSFESYWDARGKNLRSNLKKQRARLAKDGVPLRMQVSRGVADVAQAVADYGRLESAGWKAGEGTAVAADNDQGRYYRAMLERFCARGAASIYRYWFGEQLAAMDLCVEDAQQIIVLKTTYDESIPKSLSPTLLMREEACRALFEAQRFERLEFYGKVMEWHTRWTDEVRTLYHINFYRWPIIASLHARQQARRPT
jgi:hypothetical protein